MFVAARIPLVEDMGYAWLQTGTQLKRVPRKGSIPVNSWETSSIESQLKLSGVRHTEEVAELMLTAKKMGRRWKGPSYIDREAIQGAALEGLVRGIQTYNYLLGSFRPYIISKMYNSVIDALRTTDHLSRADRRNYDPAYAYETHKFPYSLQSLVKSTDGSGETELINMIEDPTSQEAFQRMEDKDEIVLLLRGKNPQEIATLALIHYGDWTQREVSELFNITESRVSQRLSSLSLSDTKFFSRQELEKLERTPIKVTSVKTEISNRELEVLRLIAEGLTNIEIGTQLEIGEETIKTHVRHILKKLNTKSRAYAVASAFRSGLLE